MTDLRVIAPEDGIYKDKLYAAYINSADKLTVAGDKGQAAAQLSKAVQLDPTRDEAASRQLALTPTPLPATATPVPAPAAPPNVQQYMNYQVPLLTRASSGLQALGDQSTQAGNNAYVMADPTWRTRTALALSELKSAGQQIQKYEPVPAELKRLDALMVSFGKDLVYISDEYAAGVDNVSAVRLGNAASRLQTMPAKSQTILGEVNAIADRYGIRTGQ